MQIVDFELSLYDTQGAATGGLREEFLCSSRIDNLASCFVAVEALLTHSAPEMMENDKDVSHTISQALLPLPVIYPSPSYMSTPSHNNTHILFSPIIIVGESHFHCLVCS